MCWCTRGSVEGRAIIAGITCAAILTGTKPSRAHTRQTMRQTGAMTTHDDALLVHAFYSPVSRRRTDNIRAANR